MQTTQKQIIESIYDEEIFLEKRRRIHLLDVFFYTLNGLEPIIVYVAQAEHPEPDGSFRHGYAFYSVLDGHVVENGGLLQKILFSKMPKLSKLVDVNKSVYASQDFRSAMDDLIHAFVAQNGLDAAQVAQYVEYLEAMQEMRPDNLRPLYDFFLDNVPEPKPGLGQ